MGPQNNTYLSAHELLKNVQFHMYTFPLKFRDLIIFMSYTVSVCQLSGHKKKYMSRIYCRMKLMVLFKVEEEKLWSRFDSIIDMQEAKNVSDIPK